MSGFSIDEWSELAGFPTGRVPEVRYDVHGTTIHYEKPGRYRGLLAHEASALSDALYHDLPERQCERTGATLPPSPCLLTLRKRWAERAAWEAEDEATRVDNAWAVQS